ncbi:protein-disulfide reductase DsbD domain-containing protein [Faunimonas sp. B44]|uniref:protein-disulfide reductase DsbD domain-containing protein n=1 Tax=Faunimonas sp. B44 TaxID=3461493 RepID=UPI004043F0BD
MSNTIHRALLFALMLAVAPAAPASAAQSAWTPIPEGKLRLLLVRGPGDELKGGVEIALEPGWHTYWRNPGDAGVPPQFDFSGSANVERVEVRFPAPERYDDGTSVSAVYRDHVVIPLAISPRRAGAVTLKMSAMLGVCAEICIPTDAEAEVTLAAESAGDPVAKAQLALFERMVPGGPKPGQFDIGGITVGPDAISVEVIAPAGADPELFVDGPSDWFLGQPERVAQDGERFRYTIAINGRPTAEGARTIRFVATSAGSAIEKTETIR